MAAQGGRASYALAIDDRNSSVPLLLTSTEAERARVLAGSMALIVSKDLKFGFGGGLGADALLPDTARRSNPAFLMADRALDRAPVGAFAVRQAFGRLGVTLSAESGAMRLWQASALRPTVSGVRRYAYSQSAVGADGSTGPLAISVKLIRLDERATILGSYIGPALGGSGAISRFADFGMTLSPATNWQFGTTLRRGWTNLSATGVRRHSVLATRAFSATLIRDALLVPGDTLALRYSEPLRVTGGGLDLTGLGSGSALLSLAPPGHERNWEAVYARQLGHGWLTVNAYWRRQPGNYADAPDDLGAAMRYRFSF